MEEGKNKPASASNNLEEEQTTGIQKNIEARIAEDEQTLKGEELSGELSKARTHMSEHRTRMSEHRTELSDTRTVLSYQRTALSYERTLMSWIRTATSLITFGFTIYKFFEEVQKDNPEPRLLSPRLIGMLMIAFGFLGLLFAQAQHYMAYKKLRENYPEVQKSLSSVLGALVLVFGLILFLGALFRQ